MSSNRKDLALEMRRKGMSYSQIKEKTGASKSTLSYWLKDLPLSKERMVELRDKSPIRIEKYRNTMLAKKNARLDGVMVGITKDIKFLSRRELFIAGLFLYWGEGGKTKEAEISISNTDPAVLKFFLEWIETLGSDRSNVKVRIQVYKNMDSEKEVKFWSKELRVKKGQFRKTYIKSTTRLSNYGHQFFHGTCNIHLGGRDICDRVYMGLKYIRELVHNGSINRL